MKLTLKVALFLSAFASGRANLAPGETATILDSSGGLGTDSGEALSLMQMRAKIVKATPIVSGATTSDDIDDDFELDGMDVDAQFEFEELVGVGTSAESCKGGCYTNTRSWTRKCEKNKCRRCVDCTNIPPAGQAFRCPSPEGTHSECQTLQGWRRGTTVDYCQTAMQRYSTADTFNFGPNDGACYVKHCGSNATLQLAPTSRLREVYSAFCGDQSHAVGPGRCSSQPSGTHSSCQTVRGFRRGKTVATCTAAMQASSTADTFNYGPSDGSCYLKTCGSAAGLQYEATSNQREVYSNFCSEEPTTCAENEKVVNHVCTACSAGERNEAGGDASGSDTACAAILCGQNQMVVDNACIACPAGKTNSGSDDATGVDTTCDATLCGPNEKVVNHMCMQCRAGTTSTGSHDASGSDTTCDATTCGESEKVVDHACTACPAGKTNLANDDASGSDTTCDITLCGANQKVVSHACTECPAGKTSTGNHAASGSDTACDATSCGANEKVVSHACTACPAGRTNLGNDDASGDDTTCDPILCGPNQKVVNNACVACPAGETSSGNDDASGSDTTCAVPAPVASVFSMPTAAPPVWDEQQSIYTRPQVVGLTATKAAACYWPKIGNDVQPWTCAVLHINGNTATRATPVELAEPSDANSWSSRNTDDRFRAGVYANRGAVKIDAMSFVSCTVYGSYNNVALRCFVVQVLGDTFPNAATAIADGGSIDANMQHNSGQFYVALVDSSAFLTCYNIGNSDGGCTMWDITGTSVSPGTEVTHSDNWYSMAVAVYSTSLAVVCSSNGPNEAKTRCYPLSWTPGNKDTLALGAVIESQSSQQDRWRSLEALSDTTALLCECVGQYGNHMGCTYVRSLDGATLTSDAFTADACTSGCGENYDFGFATKCSESSMAVLGPNKAVAAVYGYYGYRKVTAMAVDLDEASSSIAEDGDPLELTVSSSNSGLVSRLDENSAIVAYSFSGKLGLTVLAR